MNKAAFDEMVGLIDEAVDVAESAIKAAEEMTPRRVVSPAPEVTLVKVASSRYHSVANALINTGTFRDVTAASLAKTLEKAGHAEFLEIMEKLASKAVFPFDAQAALGGDLVEKSGKSRADEARGEGESDTDLWVRCCEESGIPVT